MGSRTRRSGTRPRLSPPRFAVDRSATVAAGGWPAEFANLIGEIRSVEPAPIEFELADDLAFWRAEIPGKVSVWAEALTGPTTPEGHGFSWNRSGKSSKHIPFDWSGPS